MKPTYLVAVAVAAVGAIAIGEAGAQSGPQTFTYVKRQTRHFKFVDHAPRTKFTANGPTRLSVGDEIVQHDAYLNASGKRVGGLDLVCTVTRGGSFALSTGGGFDVHEAAIVGGTGRFAGARGTVTTRPSKSQTNRDEFHLLAP